MRGDFQTHALPATLAAAAEYASDQPDLSELQRALDAARTAVQLADTLERDSVRQRFCRREAGDDIGEVAREHSDAVGAAQFNFGEAAFLYGIACGWLLFGKDGAR